MSRHPSDRRPPLPQVQLATPSASNLGYPRISETAASSSAAPRKANLQNANEYSNFQEPSGDAKSKSDSQNVIGVLGAKGGCGASTLAMNLAVCLSWSGATAGLVDANFQQPQIASMLQKDPEFSLLDVVSRAPHIDLHLIEACAEKISPDCLLLSPPLSGQSSFARNLSELADALIAMKPLLSHWVIDLPRHLDHHLVCVIDQCKAIVLVFEPTLAGVAAARRWIDLLNQLEYDMRRVVLAVNR